MFTAFPTEAALPARARRRQRTIAFQVMRQSRMVGTARRAVRGWFLSGTVASARRPYLRQPAVTDALPFRLPGAWLFSAGLFLLSLCATAQPVEPAASYIRTNIIYDDPSQPKVNVVVTNATGVSCLTIEEILPSPATALAASVSGDGVYLPGQNVIRWGPYTNITSTNVSYRLTGLPGNYPVNGGSWMDGQWFFSPASQ